LPSPFTSPPHKALEYEDGEMKLWLPSSTVFLSRVRGYLRHEFALEIIRCLDCVHPSESIVQFHDWFAITGFDIRCQRDLTAWHVTHRSRVARLDIAAHSAIVRMGVAVANVALKGAIRLYDDVRAFERQAEQAILSAR
jgi:hypothetical protein